MKANSNCAFDDEYFSESHHILKENREEKILEALYNIVCTSFMNILNRNIITKNVKPSVFWLMSDHQGSYYRPVRWSDCGALTVDIISSRSRAPWSLDGTLRTSLNHRSWYLLIWFNIGYVNKYNFWRMIVIVFPFWFTI